jgi:2-polyprenyl-6-methoxyphenol hydroxylase-like FAD-dependent oxidoreductase
MPRQFDIGIIGAGPAGLCAALRLQQLGYRILLIERSTVWPRPQIGEALTSGGRNIIDFLDANEALQYVPLLARMPTRLCWRSKMPETIDHADAAIVNRVCRQ